MVRVRFAPSPTGSLHLGNALSAVANRRYADEHGGTLLLRIDDTDVARNVEGGVELIVAELEWLGIPFDEGPQLQSERSIRHREAAQAIGEPLHADGTASQQLASAVDDVDFGITHVICGSDRRANAELQTALIRALGGEPPEYIHHGLLLGAASLADLRAAGIPAEAVRSYLEELGLPHHDVRLDPARLRRLSIEALGRLSDEELAARVGVPTSVAPVLRGARDLREAREYAEQVPSAQRVAVDAPETIEALGQLSDEELAARVGVPTSVAPVLRGARDLREAHEYAEQVLSAQRVAVDAPETIERLRELVEGGVDPKGIVRELKAVGGNLKAVRLVLTGRERGPELAAVIAALPREELLARLG